MQVFISQSSSSSFFNKRGERSKNVANILIVDDEVHVRSLLSDVVERMGHNPLEAGNGNEAFEMYQKQSIDLCLLDINMPEMNGIDCLEAVKEIDPEAVIIMMTGYPSAETIIQTIEDDGYTYIAKPLDIQRVMDLIERGLKFRESRLRGDE